MKRFKAVGACAVVAAAIAGTLAPSSYAQDPGTESRLLLAAPFPGSADATPYGSAGSLLADELAALTREGIAQARAGEALAVQEQLGRTGLVRTLLARMGRAFGGIWFAPSAAQLNVGVTTPASRRAAMRATAEAGLQGSVRLRPVRSSWTRLQEAQQGWNRKLAALFARGAVATALDPVHNAVTVTLSPSVSRRERAALARAASTASVHVIVTHTSESLSSAGQAAETKCKIFTTANLAYCDKPITPGVTIKAGAFCTAGPLVIPAADKAKTYLLTAGHCLARRGEQAKWLAFNVAEEALLIGLRSEFVWGLAGDVGALKVNNPGNWVEAGETPVFAVSAVWEKKEEKSFPVVAERTPMVGASNCTEGQTTGGICTKVLRVGLTLRFRSGRTVSNLVEDEATPSIKPGDSGGPVIQVTKGGYLVEGTIVGFTTEGRGLFQPLETAYTQLAGLGLELLTVSNEARGKETKAEKEAGEKIEKKEGEEKVTETQQKEEEEKGNKEEKEEKEIEEEVTEGNPAIEPSPIAFAPLEFTMSSGKTIMETASKLKIECKEGSGSGKFTKLRVGTMTSEFHSCKSSGVACQTTGAAKETIVATGSVELVDLEKAKLTLGVKVAPAELAIECSALKLTIKVKGSVIGEATGVESGKATKTATALYKQEAGKQTIKECHLTKKTCEGKKFQFEASVGGKAFEEAGVESEQKLTFAEEPAVTF